MLLSIITSSKTTTVKRGTQKQNLRVVLPLPVSPTIISVSLFLTSSTSLFSTEPTTNNKILLPELRSQKVSKTSKSSAGKPDAMGSDLRCCRISCLPLQANQHEGSIPRPTNETIGREQRQQDKLAPRELLLLLLLLRWGAGREGWHLGRRRRLPHPESSHRRSPRARDGVWGSWSREGLELVVGFLVLRVWGRQVHCRNKLRWAAEHVA